MLRSIPPLSLTASARSVRRRLQWYLTIIITLITSLFTSSYGQVILLLTTFFVTKVGKHTEK